MVRQKHCAARNRCAASGAVRQAPFITHTMHQQCSQQRQCMAQRWGPQLHCATERCHPAQVQVPQFNSKASSQGASLSSYLSCLQQR